MNRLLNRSASLALIAALAFPHGAIAQTAEGDATVDVTAADEAELLRLKLEEEAEAARIAAEVEAAAAATAEAEQAAAAAEAEQAAAAEAEQAAAAEAEQAAAAEAEQAAAAEAEQAAAAEAEQAAAAEAEQAAAAEAEQAAAAEAERVAAEQAAQAAAEEADAAAAQEAEAAAVEEDAEATPEETVVTEPEAESATDAETVAPETAETVQPETTETPAEAETETVVIDPVDEQRDATVQAEREAEAAQSAATSETAEAAVVETEEVTEDTSRSSDEEFAVQAPAASSDGGGLSKFEKALLLGLGAVVVGSVLKNGDKVVSNSGDRVVIEGQDGLRVLKDDNELMRRPGSDVRTETFNDGSTRTIVTRPNGNRVITIAAADGRVVQRLVLRPDGSEVVLIDDTAQFAAVDTQRLVSAPRPRQRDIALSDELALRMALAGQVQNDPGRNFSLSQVRGLRSVRELAPMIELDALTFASGSAAINANQAEELVALGRAISDVIVKAPGSVFLIEGHTDAVGSDALNLSLSDRRAESVALALTEYFDVPPENLITQGYGESSLKVQTLAAEQANRRAVVRNITPLLR